MGCFEEIPRVAKAINWRLKSDIKSIEREKEHEIYFSRAHEKIGFRIEGNFRK